MLRTQPGDKKKFTFNIKGNPKREKQLPNFAPQTKSKTIKHKDIPIGVPLKELRVAANLPIPQCLNEMILHIRDRMYKDNPKELYFDVETLIPNSTATVGSIRKQLRNGTPSIDLAPLAYSPLVTSELLLAWLSGLPEPLFSSSKKLLQLIKGMEDAFDEEDIYPSLQSLPTLAYNSVQHIVALLADIVRKSPFPEQIKIISETLGPLMFKTPAADDIWAEQILQTMIQRSQRIFSRTRTRNNFEWKDVCDEQWFEETVSFADKPVYQITEFLTLSTVNTLFDSRLSIPEDYSLQQQLIRPWTGDYVKARCVRDQRKRASYGPRGVVLKDGDEDCDYKTPLDSGRPPVTPRAATLALIREVGILNPRGSIGEDLFAEVFKEREEGFDGLSFSENLGDPSPGITRISPRVPMTKKPPFRLYPLETQESRDLQRKRSKSLDSPPPVQTAFTTAKPEKKTKQFDTFSEMRRTKSIEAFAFEDLSESSEQPTKRSKRLSILSRGEDSQMSDFFSQMKKLDFVKEEKDTLKRKSPSSSKSRITK